MSYRVIKLPPVFPYCITQAYKGNQHTGIDFTGWDGQRRVVALVAAGLDGTVEFARMESEDPRKSKWGGRGNCITIRSDDNQSVYAVYYHLESIRVKEGDKVSSGTIIGKIGNSGYSFGAHLHFEIKVAQPEHQIINGIPWLSTHDNPDRYYVGDMTKQQFGTPQPPPPNEILFSNAAMKPDPDKMPLLKRGDMGADVEYLQESLGIKGHILRVDGIMGDMTVEFLKQFQSVNALQPDGICGPRTWQELLN